MMMSRLPICFGDNVPVGAPRSRRPAIREVVVSPARTRSGPAATVAILFLARFLSPHSFPGIANRNRTTAMDLIAYLLNSVIESTTPPGETAAEAHARGAAIAAMLRAYDPSDGMEAMMACQCVMMQFLLNAAMRDANNPHLTPVLQAKARAGAISASRTLHQWVTNFENSRKRNELRAAEAAKTEAAVQAAAPSQAPTARPVPQPEPSPANRSPTHGPAPNDQLAVAADPAEYPPIAAAAAVRSAASDPGFAGSGAPTAPPPALPAELSTAA